MHVLQVCCVVGTNVCEPLRLPYPCTSEACKYCPAGFGVREHCNRTIPTVCEQCFPGVNYSGNANPYYPCQKVTKCPDSRIIVKEATAVSDAQCGCRKGYTEDSLGICRFEENPTHNYTSIATQHTIVKRAKEAITENTTCEDSNSNIILAIFGSLSLLIPMAVVLTYCVRRRLHRHQNRNLELPLLSENSSELGKKSLIVYYIHGCPQHTKGTALRHELASTWYSPRLALLYE